MKVSRTNFIKLPKIRTNFPNKRKIMPKLSEILKIDKR